ncbi:MAG TPA: enoyl-CoA hydratase/isomerase family protein [Puia sp.]|nr:enoyl-CoA hydratase/isomerase family protein [Puia sp.]
MITEIHNGYVKVEKRNGVTTIEFYHPQGNSLPSKILDELAKEFHFAGHDEDTKVIVLRSAGDRGFCGGASFDELAAVKTEEEGFQFFSGFAHVINAMRKCPQFILVRVQGKCVGGGVGLVAASDYAIAAAGAEIRLSELALGFGPFVVGAAIEKKIGNSAFSQLAIDSTLWRNADWARKKGLYAELHDSIDGMDESLLRLSGNLARFNPRAMAEMKKMFWKGTENWDQLLLERATISGRLVLSEYSRQAIAKFKNK